MLEVGNDNEAYDHHKKPRGDLVGRDNIPYVHLVWVLPCSEVGGDIFGDPNKKSDQYKREGEGESPYIFCNNEIYFCIEENNKDEWDEDKTNIDKKVIRKKVYINGSPKNY